MSFEAQAEIVNSAIEEGRLQEQPFRFLRLRQAPFHSGPGGAEDALRVAQHLGREQEQKAVLGSENSSGTSWKRCIFIVNYWSYS